MQAVVVATLSLAFVAFSVSAQPRSVGGAAGQTPAGASEADAASEVFALERAIAAAMVRGDVAFVQSAIAPDFVMVHGDEWTHGDPPRLVDDRASFLKRTADRIYAVIEYEIGSAEMHGDVAITTGRYIANIPGSPPGRRWFYVWDEKVYAKRGGKWVYLSHRSVDGAHYGESREAVSLRPTAGTLKQ